MKTFQFCIILSMSFLTSSCILSAIGLYDPGSVSLTGCNNSDTDVWFSYNVPHLTNATYEIKIYDNRVSYYETHFTMVESNTSTMIFDMPTYGGWAWVKRRDYPNGLRIQVWDDELIQEVGWEEFVKNMGTKYKYELEYVLDIDDLEKLNYRITYPPSGAIEQMRIVYPE